MSDHARYTRLAKMSEIINSNLDEDLVMDALTTIISEEVFQCDSVGIYLPAEGGKFRGYTGKPHHIDGVTLDQMVIDPSADQLALEILESRKSIYIPDTSTDSRPDQRSIHLFRIISLFCLPLAFKEETYGLVFLFNSGSPMNLSPEQQQAVEAYVNMAASALHNIKQFHHINRLLAEKQLLLDVNRELAHCVTEEQIINTAFKYIGQVLDNQNIAVHLSDYQGKRFRPANLNSDSEWTESDWKETHKDIKLNYDKDRLFQEVIQTQKAVLVPDVTLDPRPNQEACRHFGIRGIFMMPLVAAGQVLGTIPVVSLGKPRTYPEAARHLAQSIADSTATALSNIIRMEHLERIVEERTEEALSKHKLIQLILHSAGEGIYGLNTEGQITFCNPAAAEMLGYAMDELIGVLHEQILCSREPSAEPVYSLVSSVPVQEESEQAGEEWTLRKKNGDCFTVEAVSSPIVEEEEIVGSVIVFKDITERKRAEDIIRKAEKLSVVGELAAGVAHEIRNPLTSLKGFVQLLRGNSTVNRSYLDIMLSELDRMNTIVSEFLFLSKPQDSIYEGGELTNILEKVVGLLESEAHLRNVQFRLHYQFVPIMIHCSENQLKQAIINILKNAIEAMPNGGVISIDVASCDEGRIRIQIADQGTGISKERIGKLGEPFFTTKEKGFGLGLMVTSQIIKQHRGEISFYSDGVKGTTVTLTLPMTREE
ncbi:ATP-binding protein [Paenibacillus chartarius]|uniref:histidine kinase n=1 Tax=Paenibacillus chartarius TaxID=747481 RepID=A0ABV6DMW6_9BACL